MPTVTVFTTNQCPRCTVTKAHLRKRGVQFDEVNLSDHPSLAEKVKELGFMSAPLVLVGDDDVIQGYSPDALDEIAKDLADTAA
jgi:glutaredoxin-like protein NrdH